MGNFGQLIQRWKKMIEISVNHLKREISKQEEQQFNEAETRGFMQDFFFLN